ncbi:hypothetical protein BJ912DRAFT_1052204 [Pholiota molesta]|nr:hypothetical protein BJ912DRAFT_1052204 [Pholiota molesta]
MTDSHSVPFPAYKQPPKAPLLRSRVHSRRHPRVTPEAGKGRFRQSTVVLPIPIANEARTYSRPLSPEKPHVPRTPQSKARKASTASTSSSDYSDESEVTDIARNGASVAPSSVTKRSSTLSKGGADKRRIAIVEMDRVGEQARKSNSDVPSSTNPARSRRPHGNTLTGLALVAPPDASLKSTPIQQDKGHHRSASENPADLDKAVSRDTGSVGVVAQEPKSKPPFLSANHGPTKNTKADDKKTGISSPAHVFQPLTTSRTPSPTKHSDLGNHNRVYPSPLDRTPMSTRTVTSQVLTPAIGEGKDIHIPVAGPVVVKLDNLPPRTAHSMASWRSESPTPSYGSGSNHGSSYSASATSSYLHYEPGVHATAGPLPPPPRAMFNIDITSPPPPRPPRLHSPTPLSTSSRARGDFEAVKQALQLPPSSGGIFGQIDKKPMKEENEEAKKKTEVQEKKEEVCSEEKNESIRSSEVLHPTKSIHRREAATLSTSTDSTSEPTSSTVPASLSETSSPLSTNPIYLRLGHLLMTRMFLL